MLLDTCARFAEERYLLSELLKVGRGADDESPVEETRDAIKDHNEIRDTAEDAIASELGSSRMVRCGRACEQGQQRSHGRGRAAGADRLPPARRAATCVIGSASQFAQFESEHLTGTGVKPIDRNVDAYVLENS